MWHLVVDLRVRLAFERSDPDEPTITDKSPTKTAGEVLDGPVRLITATAAGSSGSPTGSARETSTRPVISSNAIADPDQRSRRGYRCYSTFATSTCWKSSWRLKAVGRSLRSTIDCGLGCLWPRCFAAASTELFVPCTG